jgi:hypothetical protein
MPAITSKVHSVLFVHYSIVYRMSDLKVCDSATIRSPLGDEKSAWCRDSGGRDGRLSGSRTRVRKHGENTRPDTFSDGESAR